MILNLGVDEVDDVNATRQECTKLIAGVVAAGRGAQYPVLEVVVVSIIVSAIYVCLSLMLTLYIHRVFSCGWLMLGWLGLIGILIRSGGNTRPSSPHASPCHIHRQMTTNCR